MKETALTSDNIYYVFLKYLLYNSNNVYQKSLS